MGQSGETTQKGNSKDDRYTQLYFRFESTTVSILWLCNICIYNETNFPLFSQFLVKYLRQSSIIAMCRLNVILFSQLIIIFGDRIFSFIRKK